MNNQPIFINQPTNLTRITLLQGWTTLTLSILPRLRRTIARKL